jgi:hypothetical protein
MCRTSYEPTVESKTKETPKWSILLVKSDMVDPTNEFTLGSKSKVCNNEVALVWLSLSHQISEDLAQENISTLKKSSPSML